MNGNFTINSTNLLLVEGKDECNFFNALFSSMSISSFFLNDYGKIESNDIAQSTHAIQIVDIGGAKNFAPQFPYLYGMEGFGRIEKLGFVRDAEEKNAKSAFDSICDILKKHGLPSPDKVGEINSSNSPWVGIFIMPDNCESGMLEDLCLESIKTEKVYSCVDNFVKCFEKGYTEEGKKHCNIHKAKVQAYLSAKSPIVPSLGLGAKLKHWDFTHPCFNGIKNFLTLSFDIKGMS